MSKFPFSFLLLLCSFSASARAQDTKAITDAESVVAVYTNDSALGVEDPRLILSVWGDGTIVWSQDRLKGGGPYFESKIAPADVSAMLKRFDAIGVFDVPRLGQANFGPDSEFTTILVRTEGKVLQMDSWHELYESNGKVIAADRGLTGLEKKKLLQSLAEQPAEYLHYRLTWLQLRLDTANLIPTAGSKAVGVPKMLHGKLSWQPDGTEQSDEPKSR